MSEGIKNEIGSISWVDLTIENADEVKDFYSSVTGWKAEPLSMGEYNDYVMNSPESGKAITGVCHAKGVNANLPPQWLIYITVKDVDESAKKCKELGGKVLVGPKEMANYGRYCIIQDPAGAVAALFTPINS